MLSLFLFLFVSIGGTLIVVNGSIFEKTRTFVKSQSLFLGEWISCPQCFGFFVGLLCSLFGLSQTYSHIVGDYWFLNSFFYLPVSLFMDGCIASLFAMITNWLLILFESYNNLLAEQTRREQADADVSTYMAIKESEELEKKEQGGKMLND